uniref:DnaJ homolog subfamily C member 10 n=1 Tax=Elaeophora elaphi TaxID=1147741 RepID=A0A0R3RQK7_9BILA
MHFIFVLQFLLFLLISYVNCEDFYHLLGISREADNRAIRRAFKKLALVKHPDKNPNDNNAHKEFMRLYRAYEVLMDEELRKRYDRYGEEGLNDNYKENHHYQSWQFYKDNFGIYDEDKEIVTLSRSDFERTVSKTDEIWFINFYSTFCSHCHQLAPTWRKFAQEMEGVLRIGAVNCAEDPMLCHSQGVMGYPSLVIYPHRHFFHGKRQLNQLIAFAMEYATGVVLQLTDSHRDLFQVKQSEKGARGWLLDFCGHQSSDCLSELNRRKLATSLHGLVNVAKVNCDESLELCTLFDRKSGVVYFRPGDGRKPDRAREINSLDFKEIASIVLTYVPDIPYIDKVLEGIFEAQNRDRSFLIRFGSGEIDNNAELKRLPAKLPSDEIEVYFANCSITKDICENLKLTKLPKWVLFKKKGSYEIYHGKMETAYDIALFATESHSSPLVTLTPETYASAIDSGDEWLIDYYAPWCPPCLRLLQELRRLHNYVERIKIGTIDCVQHSDICRKANVHAYPNIVWYNAGRSSARAGYLDVSTIAEFIEDARNPIVVDLSPSDFDPLVLDRKQGTVWLVDFYAPWCGPCNQLAPEYKKLARNMRMKGFLHFGMVDCDHHRQLCLNLGVQSYPTIRLYSSGPHAIDYPSNWWRDHRSMELWLGNYLPSKVVSIGNDFFAKVVDDDKPWLVDFFVTWCSHCIEFAPVFEHVAEVLEGRVKLAKVDCGLSPNVCRSVGVVVYPTIRYYSGSRGGHIQMIRGVPIELQDAHSIVHQVEKELTKIDRLYKTEL